MNYFLFKRKSRKIDLFPKVLEIFEEIECANYIWLLTYSIDSFMLQENYQVKFERMF
jgi:hypothetical protein